MDRLMQSEDYFSVYRICVCGFSWSDTNYIGESYEVGDSRCIDAKPLPINASKSFLFVILSSTDRCVRMRASID